MESRALKITSPMNSKISLKIIPGHFATGYSHVNFYIDMTSVKTRLNEAMEAAKTMVKLNNNDMIVDTIVCMDGCEVIGGFLALELNHAGILSMNTHETFYIISPEYNNGQLIFRENNLTAVSGKHILLLVASVTTGNTVRKSLECIKYYGGNIQGINAIFSAVDTIEDIPINSIYKTADLPEYKNYNITSCPQCKKNNKIEAIINGYGYTKLL
ncbi:orotate phosphoribosyltransferase [Anaerocolumna sp. AGMB13025]|uniref:orotate phosphoribosyltransferase n=1 Tax=Anaerocolumna sp. AGMB13025 TaxID=3039116 RepID=UPI00241E67E7|nr:orotate phosphoribosyltransferase [Anaerocolumna sp. AGMB13025]WFR57513.1 orotate phosphoribosyltransferase [Anaerocolumna sp. AGMB13025]